MHAAPGAPAPTTPGGADPEARAAERRGLLDAHEAEARAERLRIAYAHLPMIVAASVPTSVVSAIVVWGHVPSPRLLGWLAAVGVVGALRLALHRAFSARPRTAGEGRLWTLLLGAAMTLAGGVFGGFVMLPEGPADLLVIATGAISTAGLVAGGAQSLIAAPRVLAVSVAAALVPLGLAIGACDEPAVRPFAIMVPLFLVTMTGVGRQNWLALNESLALRFENLDIAARLAVRTEAAEQARRRADEARRDKNRFLAAASHDLRHPLGTLGVIVSALAEEPQSPRGEQLLANARDALRPLGGLIEGLLELSRIEAGTVPVRLQTVDLAEVAAGLESVFAPVARDAGLELRVVRPRDLHVTSDPLLLERVLSNLVANALRYTEAGRVLVCFRRRGGAVLAQVWDTGPGIPEDQLEEIFQPFHRLTDRGQGVGLGLAVVAGLSTRLGAPVHVRSRVGRGTLFEVALPRTAGADVRSRAETPPAARHLLILHPDAVAREGLAKAAEGWGYRATLAGDVEQVAACLEAEPTVDGVLTSGRLAGDESCFEVLEVIEDALGALPPTVVVLPPEETAAAGRARAAGHLVVAEPLRPDALREALARHLGRAAPRTY